MYLQKIVLRIFLKLPLRFLGLSDSLLRLGVSWLKYGIVHRQDQNQLNGEIL